MNRVFLLKQFELMNEIVVVILENTFIALSAP